MQEIGGSRSKPGLNALLQGVFGADVFITARALTLGCVLVTANERKFARIDGLRCEN
jgi:hypothetical protein